MQGSLEISICIAALSLFLTAAGAIVHYAAKNAMEKEKERKEREEDEHRIRLTFSPLDDLSAKDLAIIMRNAGGSLPVGFAVDPENYNVLSENLGPAFRHYVVEY